MAWILLLLAGLFEIGWAVALKYSEGFTRFWPTAATAGSLVASMVLLGVAIRTLPLSTAYGVWTGIGTVGAAAFGMLVLNEPASALKIGCIVMIVAGIVGLKLAS